MDLKLLLRYACEHGASDIHISPNYPPMLRILGSISALNIPKPTFAELEQVLHTMLPESLIAKFYENLELDCVIELENLRYRVNIFHSLHGYSIAIRLINQHIRTLSDIKVPIIIKQITSLTKGLVLVTGPSGSGKTSTLAAMIDYINHNDHKHIITIEDPVEYCFNSNKCLINQREVGIHTKSFANALRNALREDPDIIMVGELRDLESIQLALTAAETGHLVLATLHTNSASKTIDRIIDVFPAGDKPLIRAMLASSLEAVISQILLPNADRSDRVAAFEILINTPSIKNLIRENKIHQIPSIMEVGSKHGMILMSQALQRLLDEKQILEKDIAIFSNIIDERSNTISNRIYQTSDNSIIQNELDDKDNTADHLDPYQDSHDF